MKSNCISRLLLISFLFLSTLSQGQTITLYAGTSSAGFSGDGGQATAAALYHPAGMVVDAAGNVYFADQANNRIRKISTTGIITTVAGNGTAGFAGNGGAATAAMLDNPCAVAFDASGNMYIADYNNAVIRKVNTSGIISVFCGTTTIGYTSDGGAATNAAIARPTGVAVDGSGNVYFSEQNNMRIRKVSTTGILTTAAGNGSGSFAGDGGSATAASISYPAAIFIDGSNNLYICDAGNNRIRKVTAAGIISSIAGNGGAGFSGDGGAAVSAAINNPSGISVDAAGSVYICDLNNQRVRKITGGIMSTIAGNGTSGSAGNGSAATAAQLYNPSGVVVTSAGTIYIADNGNNQVRRVGSSVSNTPTFNNGLSQSMGMCVSASAMAINTLLAITDVDISQTETWSVALAPAHGALAGFPRTATSTGGTITPSGLTYTPTSGYSGLDSFKIQISDGALSSMTTVYVTMSGTPSAGTITGSTSVCAGSTIALGNSVTGGVWSSANTSLATVNSAGVVTGVSGGNNTISYAVSNSCGTAYATYVDTVKALPGAGTITGATHQCTGSNITLSDAVTGGTWTSSNSAVATVTTTGIVHSTLAGTVTITYTTTNACGSSYATKLDTIVTAASAGSITGSSSVCVGGVTTLGNASGGGVWSSSNNSVATINSSGIVTGVTAGSATITYTITNLCNTSTATLPITVTVAGTVSAITGASHQCSGGAITLSDATGGGTWTTSNSGIATVSATGVVQGVSAGNVTISYGVANACGTVYATKLDTVITPANAGSLTGSTTLCVGSSTTLNTSIGGGSWSSSNTAVATVNSAGMVTGVSIGSVTITYTVTNLCNTAYTTRDIILSVPLGAGTITGATRQCTGSNITLTDAAGGGNWSSSNSLIATVSPSGVVTGLLAGTVGISYGVTNSCGTVYATRLDTISVAANAGSITGASSVCVAGTTALGNSAGGGVWSSSNSAIATVNASGVVTGVSAGSATISYVVSNTCSTASTTLGITVSSPASAGTINGATRQCTGTTITLTDATGGGVWSSSNSSIATVSATGVVSGLLTGTATVSYGVTNACGTVYATKLDTVSAPASAGTITGTASVCVAGTTALSNASGGGVWSSSNAAIATINASGVVTGVSAGSATISYVVTNTCSSATTSLAITVVNAASVAAITGATRQCTSSTITLTDATSGGVWSSSNSSIATVSATGVVSGLLTGTATISYGVTNACGTTYATKLDTVSAPASAGTITGTASVCVAGTTALSNASGGGVWSSSNAAIATVNASGVVTGVAAGSATISYVITNTCSSASTSLGITVVNAASVAAITGATRQCTGSTITLTDATSGGVWSSSNSSIATVSATGVVSGLLTGTATISYGVTNACGTTYATKLDTVSAPASAGTITGTATVCVAGTTALSNASGGGVWSSSNAAIATVNSSGVVTGVAAGSATISYVVTNTCSSASTSLAITVVNAASVAAITGATRQCTGSNITLTDATGGGVWSSSNSSVASVSATGVVSGLLTGTAMISYGVTNACGTTYATKLDTVSAPASAGTITGTASVCVAGTTALSNASGGGVWSSSNAAIATINASGVVTGVSAGSATISYVVTNTCSSATTSLGITVVNAASVAAITGATRQCTSSTITLTDATSGGVWSSSNSSIASVSSTGVVSGLLTGTATISYGVTNACGTTYATKLDTVSAPASAGTITGTASVCVAGTTALSNASGGGVWSSSNAAIATVNASGVVTGVSAGSATISYVVTNTCSSATTSLAITVVNAASVAAITGATRQCTGSNITLTDATGGGVWSSSNSSIATVSATGVVSGLLTGTATISYGVTNACGTTYATKLDTVSAPASAGNITGTASVCVAGTTALSNASGGGVWSSSNTAIATVSASGVVTGVSAGSATISYVVTNTCSSASTSLAITVVNAASVAAITGATRQCTGSTITLTDATSGGVWSSSNSSIATVSATGVVSGLLTGTATISYGVTNACGTTYATKLDTVSAPASAGTITGTASVCVAGTTALSNASGGGVWSSSNTAIATVSASGVVTGVSAGSATISYVVTNTCSSASTSLAITVVNAASVAAITGATRQCTSSTITLTDATSGGTWSSSNSSVASVSATGVVSGLLTGTATISYGVTNVCGTTYATKLDTVSAPANAGTITGTASACVAGTTALSDASGGGTWTSANVVIATVNTSGVVTGVSAGSTTISYTVTNTCSSATTTQGITIVNSVSAGTITGASRQCTGTNITLTDATGGGVWSSSNSSVASVSAAGVVSGLLTGTATISYAVTNACGSAYATAIDTVSAPANAGSITGTTTVCVAGTTALSDASGGGTWSSSNAAIATVNSSGVVTGVSAGSATITYSVSNVCTSASTTAAITVVNPASAGSITGATRQCTGTNITLTDATGGGVWSSSNSSIATVSSTGVVSGLLTGTATISYGVTNACGTTYVTKLDTVSAPANAGTITGTSTVCVAGTTGLSDASGGGVWSSMNAAVATVNSSGVVTGVSAGSTTISYVVTNTCSSATATLGITVSSPASAGTIIGASRQCTGSNITLTDATGGGTWSTSNSTIATISGTGVVSGLVTGTVVISYGVSNVCGVTFATKLDTVSAPANAGSITGTSTVCVAGTTGLGDASGGGVWTSSNAAIATVNSSGVVTGVSAGSATISYTVTNTCSSATATLAVTVVNAASAGTISGVSRQCTGTNITLTDATGGGTWSSSNSSIATVSSTGVVSGLLSGTVIISYGVTNACGTTYATKLDTVAAPANAGSITGTSTVCVAGTTGLGNAAGGGTWSTANAAIATVNTSGVVTGVLAGSTTISYTVTNTCSSATTTMGITVSNPASAGVINGATHQCTGTNITLTDATGGGTWSSSNSSIATISATGVVSGLLAGTVTISYGVTNACGTTYATKFDTVLAPANAGSITGASAVCVAATTALGNSVGGGTWSSSNAAMATINSSGVVTGVSAGSLTISYVVTNSCNTATATMAFTVNPLASAGTITGTTAVLVGGVTTLSDAASGGTWSSSNTSVATVGATGIVSGIAGGSSTISYTVSNTCGPNSAVATVTVSWGSGYIITTVAGTGVQGWGYDGAAATASMLNHPQGVTVDAGGNLYIAESDNESIRKVNTSGVLSTVAGSGAYGFAGDGGSATAAYMNSPSSVVLDAAGNMYIADYNNARVRKVNTSGIITTIAGNGAIGFTADGANATAAAIARPVSVAVDASGNVYFTEQNNHRVRKISTTGVLMTAVGNGTPAFTGDGGTAASASISYPSGLSIDVSGNMYIADGGNNRIRKVSASGIISTIAGNGSSGASGDGSAATAAALNNPSYAAADAMGNVFVCDYGNNKIRKINSSGIISTFAGTGASGFSGDNGQATAATLTTPTGLIVTAAGVVYVADYGNSSVRKIQPASGVPVFVGGSVQALNLCTSAAATSINGLMSITDINSGQTETWTVVTAPAHGSLGGFPRTAASTGGQVTPSSLTYTPTVGYSGMDSFKVQVSDGALTSMTTVLVTASSAPSVSSITGASSLLISTPIVLGDLTTGGVWSSTNNAIATVSGTGLVTGVAAGIDTIKYTVSNSCSSVFAMQQVTVLAGKGVNPTPGAVVTTTAEVLMYPNPTSGLVTIEFPENSGNSVVYVTDINGKVVQQITTDQVKVVVDLGQLAHGAYIIKTVNANGTYTGKVLLWE